MKPVVFLAVVDQYSSAADDVFVRIDRIVEIQFQRIDLVFKMNDQGVCCTIRRRKIFDLNITLDDLVRLISKVTGIGFSVFDLDRSFLEITLSV